MCSADLPAWRHGEVDDAVVAAGHLAVQIDDIAGLGRAGMQFFDDAGIRPVGNEADVLAVRLFGDRQPEPFGVPPGFRATGRPKFGRPTITTTTRPASAFLNG